MLEHGEQIIDVLGSQVDRIERNIKVSYRDDYARVPYTSGILQIDLDYGVHQYIIYMAILQRSVSSISISTVC